MSDDGLPHQFFDMLMASQWWSADALRSYQRSQLSQLLRHARDQVPFYEHRLDAVFKPDGDIDWDRWNEVPIVRRQDLVEQGDAMLARQLPNAHGTTTVSVTSGTSGASVQVTSTQLAHIALHANRFRSYDWHQIDWTRLCCSVLLNADPEIDAWPDGSILGPWGPEWEAASIDGALIRINRSTPADKILEFLVRKQPAYLTTGPKAALALALEAEATGIDLKFDAYLPHGEALTDDDRAAMLRVFGARSLDLYSSKEAGHIAVGCPEDKGLHVNAESVLVEIVDDRGQPVPPGTLGRVIVTPFFNAAQPLIRYDQGDVAILTEPCRCGRHLPRLARLVGRASTVFYHPDGRVRASFVGMHRHLLRCTAWQIVQVGPTEFEVRYVPEGARDTDGEAALRDRIREAYFEDSEVRFVVVADIPLSAAGKPIEYVNGWMPAR